MPKERLSGLQESQVMPKERLSGLQESQVMPKERLSGLQESQAEAARASGRRSRDSPATSIQAEKIPTVAQLKTVQRSSIFLPGVTCIMLP